jgi:beta-phosphoglucomutase
MHQITFGVIFDVDGVLVDSYEAHFQSWREVAREHDLDFTEKDFARSFGRTSRDIVRMLWPDGASMDDARVRAIDDRKEALYRRIVAARFPAMDGARELIDLLWSAGCRLAAGSSGPPENVELCLRELRRAARFNAVVTGFDVTRGKPDPQVFLLAAERISLPPSRCAVIEDAPAGIEAARRGGMKAIGLVSRGRTAHELREADLVIHSLRELNVQQIRALLDT